ncbi:hypothetical protein JHK82_049290 [Glycine max]|nr:hypothetical protein JHK86_049148 [Glycine max]KAG4934985.1 hypothetical protein JHK85_049904 [Glycine max]KAG5090512.1 hypothetical protein JHK82_049290 [Glycine max]KAG5093597.1 hypothetical protein JHK84_049185 [Glycine max]
MDGKKKELEESKNLNDVLQKKLTEEKRSSWVQNEQFNAKVVQLENQIQCNQKLEWENQQLKGKAMKLQEELQVQNQKLNSKVVQLENQIQCNQKLELENQQLKGKLARPMEKDGSLKDAEDFSQSLIIIERERNDELQKARKKLIMGIAEISSYLGNIGVKRMGEIDTEPFLMKCVHYGKIITEIIDDEDETSKGLKEVMGVGAYNAVVTALKEMMKTIITSF